MPGASTVADLKFNMSAGTAELLDDMRRADHITKQGAAKIQNNLGGRGGGIGRGGVGKGGNFLTRMLGTDMRTLKKVPFLGGDFGKMGLGMRLMGNPIMAGLMSGIAVAGGAHHGRMTALNERLQGAISGKEPKNYEALVGRSIAGEPVSQVMNFGKSAWAGIKEGIGNLWGDLFLNAKAFGRSLNGGTIASNRKALVEQARYEDQKMAGDIMQARAAMGRWGMAGIYEQGSSQAAGIILDSQFSQQAAEMQKDANRTLKEIAKSTGLSIEQISRGPD